MNSLIKYALGLSLSGLLLVGCNSKTESAKEETTPVSIAIDDVRLEHAPDRRVAIFDVESAPSSDAYVIRGESNLPEAVADLKQRLDAENITYTDSIQMLPAADLEGKTRGVIQISVANLRSRPSHSSELVTQATLGTPVKVLKKKGSWYYIQVPDGYLAWVDYGGVTPVTQEIVEAWRETEKLIYLQPYGFSYEEPDTEAQVVSDLAMGGILELLGEEDNFYKVRYPDNREAYVEKAYSQPYGQWVTNLDPTGESLIATSMSMKGVPYLWGGTSSKGMDCSGYTKTIFFLNGMVLPRDASQQIQAGLEVDSEKNFENLEPGDLLYFGRKATADSPERIIHVGMWIGDNKFIHAMGDVHISNFDTEAEDFDQYNYDRYLRTMRVLGQDDDKVIQLAQSDLFMSGV